MLSENLQMNLYIMSYLGYFLSVISFSRVA